MTTFDEAARMALYSEDQLERLASAVMGVGRPFEGRPGRAAVGRIRRWPAPRPVTRAMVADIVTYLPGDLLVKVDLASMAHSLECRRPFLDHRVVELAIAMPLDRKIRLRSGRTKIVLKQAFADLLPPPIRTRSKMGFGVPIGRWFREELKDELRGVLLDPVCLGRGLFRPEAIETFVAEHVDGIREHRFAFGPCSCSSCGFAAIWDNRWKSTGAASDARPPGDDRRGRRADRPAYSLAARAGGGAPFSAGWISNRGTS